MRARIMLLPGSGSGEKICGYAEQILTDISAAFDHSFSLMREKVGEKSLAESGEALTEQAADACAACQAVILCDASCPGAAELYDALDLPLRLRSFSVPEALCGRHETPVGLYIGTVLSLDQDTLRRALGFAFRFALEEDILLSYVCPTGPSRQEWEAAIRVQQVNYPRVSVSAVSAPAAAAALVNDPSSLGLLLCPPYAGGILDASATALCAHPSVIYDLSAEEDLGLYAAYLPPEAEILPDPCGVALALARMLKYSLGLIREAACVEAAVSNVMSRTRDPDAEVQTAQEMVDRMCEQIAVAGELMVKGRVNR